MKNILAKIFKLRLDFNMPSFDFSRAMRYYYKRKELVIVRRKLIYQFGPRMKNWRQ